MYKVEIAQQFLPLWPRPLPEMQVRPLGDGHINDTYLVESERFRFVLQRINTQVFKDPETVQRNLITVWNHLTASRYSLKFPVLCPTAEGHLFTDEVGSVWRAFVYLENTFTPTGKLSPQIAFEAANAVGLFLKNISDLPAERLAETIPGFHDTEQRWAVFEKILAENPAGRNAGAAVEIDSLFAQKHLFEHISQLRKSGDLPLRPTHNDPKAGNVLLDLDTKKAVAVIDLDTVMPGTIPSDFGDMLRSFAPTLAEDDPEVEKMGVDLPVVEAMCRGFIESTGGFLTEIERENLFAGGLWIVFEQSLRFLTDFLAGDVYYKTGYATHNLVRARNQLALLAALGKAEREVRGFLS